MLVVLTAVVVVTRLTGLAGAGAMFGTAATCTPGTAVGLAVLAGTAAPVPGLAGAEPAILFKSPRFLVNSATRVEASLASLSLAILSSAAALLETAPLDKVSLSGIAATAERSSTLA